MMERTDANLQAQLDEIDGLRCIYSEHELEVQEVAQGGFKIDATLPLEGIASGAECFAGPVHLSLRVPAAYPTEGLCLCSLLVEGVSPSSPSLCSLKESVAACIAGLPLGEEVIFMAITEAISLCNDASQRLLMDAKADNDASPNAPSPVTPIYTRCSAFVLFHHIKSSTKRRHLQQWAAEHGLSGFSRPGTPGVLFVQGEQHGLDLYLKRVRSMHWKKMSVMWYDEQQSASPNDMPPPLFPSFTERMCDLIELLPDFKRGNIEHVFWDGTKIPNTSDGPS
eukprot:TRINITY_DN8615_c0_g1_i1.p1 TRINITY_DN8615_c0_g1~~TRINITY_DN8615_c0_g1_i1.p1  ORF type:complete len:281 (+),score=68.61 TRINITY_DN8615_c0_g1_i1:137-979(+)